MSAVRLPWRGSEGLTVHGAAAWAGGLLLAALMVCTRGQHVASLDGLPSASWAVFFLAGALLRPVWMLPLLFGLASALDLAGMAAGSLSDWCVSPAYWTLALAYAALWCGGRVYAMRLHRGGWRDLPRLLLALVLSGSVAYLLSKGGFYVFSGRYPQASLAGFIARVPQYYPPALGGLAAYVGAVLAVRASVHAVIPRSTLGVGT